MANPKFDPENPTYPAGFYPVATKAKTNFRQTRKSGTPEMDFKSFMYFIGKKANGTRDIVSDRTIRDIIHSPDSPLSEELDGMVMVGPSGEFVPAHLPNLVDVVGMINLDDVFKELSADNPEVIYDIFKISEIVPYFLAKIVDPIHELDIEGPIYPFKIQKTRTELACYSDGLQIFYLHAKISSIDVVACFGKYKVDPFLKFMDVSIETSYVGSEKGFELGSSVVLWNARGITRPRFKQHVLKIQEVHKPMIVIISETRVGKKSFDEVVNVIEGDMNWTFDESVGLSGGFSIIWDQGRVESDEMLVCGDAEIPLRMLGTLKGAKETPAQGADKAATGEGSSGEGKGAGEMSAGVA